MGRAGCGGFLVQLLEIGFIHGDPHPGARRASWGKACARVRRGDGKRACDRARAGAMWGGVWGAWGVCFWPIDGGAVFMRFRLGSKGLP